MFDKTFYETILKGRDPFSLDFTAILSPFFSH